MEENSPDEARVEEYIRAASATKLARNMMEAETWDLVSYASRSSVRLQQNALTTYAYLEIRNEGIHPLLLLSRTPISNVGHGGKNIRR